MNFKLAISTVPLLLIFSACGENTTKSTAELNEVLTTQIQIDETQSIQEETRDNSIAIQIPNFTSDTELPTEILEVK